jgi:hypothetical protein
MRYEKKVIVLSSVLAALLLVWAAGIVFSPERAAARSESAHLLAGKAADVASISIKGSGGATIELSKSGSSWSLVDGAVKFPVQATRVSSFLGELSGLVRLRIVARSKDSWAGFQLDDAQAKRATLKDASGKVLADLYVGGYGPTGGEVYVRRSGSDISYTAETGMASYLGYGRSTWLDLKVLGELKEGDVQSFSVKSSIALDGKGKASLNLDYSLRREGQGWKAGAAQIDTEAASAFLRSIIGLQGEDYVAAPPADAFSKIDARLGLELGSGQSLAIEVGSASGTDRFYARVAGKSLVFLVSSYNLRNCLKNLSDLAQKK